MLTVTLHFLFGIHGWIVKLSAKKQMCQMVWYNKVFLLNLRNYLLHALQNNSNNRGGSQGPATSESNNLPIIKLSSDSGYTKRKCCGVSKDLNFMEQSIFVGGENTGEEILKADMELLAKNRGNAMQRYKEKKKTRR